MAERRRWYQVLAFDRRSGERLWQDRRSAKSPEQARALAIGGAQLHHRRTDQHVAYSVTLTKAPNAGQPGYAR